MINYLFHNLFQLYHRDNYNHSHMFYLHMCPHVGTSLRCSRLCLKKHVIQSFTTFTARAAYDQMYYPRLFFHDFVVKCFCFQVPLLCFSKEVSARNVRFFSTPCSFILISIAQKFALRSLFGIRSVDGITAPSMTPFSVFSLKRFVFSTVSIIKPLQFEQRCQMSLFLTFHVVFKCIE